MAPNPISHSSQIARVWIYFIELYFYKGISLHPHVPCRLLRVLYCHLIWHWSKSNYSTARMIFCFTHFLQQRELESTAKNCFLRFDTFSPAHHQHTSMPWIFAGKWGKKSWHLGTVLKICPALWIRRGMDVLIWVGSIQPTGLFQRDSMLGSIHRAFRDGGGETMGTLALC